MKLATATLAFCSAAAWWLPQAVVAHDADDFDQDERQLPRMGHKPHTRPTEFPLPERPEGITEGPKGTLYVSQIVPGGVFALTPRTGAVKRVVDDQDGGSGSNQAWGLWYYKGAIFAAGGGSSFGDGTPEVYVYSAKTGKRLATCAPASLNPFGDFLNDVTVWRGIAYVTDSVNGYLMAFDAERAIYKGECDVKEIKLPSNFDPEFDDDFGANGVIQYGRGLLVGHEIDGSVWYISNLYGKNGPRYQEVIPDGGAITADGLVIDGNTLYITENFNDQVSVWKLTYSPKYDKVTATKLGEIQSELYATPGTSAVYKGYLYSANARFEALNITDPFDGDNVVAVAIPPALRDPESHKGGKKGGSGGKRSGGGKRGGGHGGW